MYLRVRRAVHDPYNYCFIMIYLGFQIALFLSHLHLLCRCQDLLMGYVCNGAVIKSMPGTGFQELLFAGSTETCESEETER